MHITCFLLADGGDSGPLGGMVEMGDKLRLYGFNNLVDAWVGDEHGRAVRIERAVALGFRNAKI